MEVSVHAPVLVLPVSETSKEGFMVDLGSLAIENTLLIPDQSVGQLGVDAYGIKLDSFKISRLDLGIGHGGIVSEEQCLSGLETRQRKWLHKYDHYVVR